MPSLLSIVTLVCLCPVGATRRVVQAKEDFIMNSETDTEGICNTLPDGPCIPQWLELCPEKCNDAKHQVAPNPSPNKVPEPGKLGDRWHPASSVESPDVKETPKPGKLGDRWNPNSPVESADVKETPKPGKLGDRWNPNSHVESPHVKETPKPGKLGDRWNPNSHVESPDVKETPKPGKLGDRWNPNSPVESPGVKETPKPGKLGDRWNPNSHVEAPDVKETPKPGKLGDRWHPNSEVASPSTSSDASASPGEATQVMCQAILTSLTEAGDGARCKPGFQWRCPTECMHFEPEECKEIQGECTQEWQKNRCTEVCKLNEFGAFQSA